jgi:signal transduction histidine kinase
MDIRHEQDILKRNAELENELALKNRELEIEAALERVRTQALAMQMPDDLLNVCKVLFKELSLLGFSEIRNAIIHTFNDVENYFVDYDYSDLTGGIITNIPYSDHPVIKRFLKQIRKSDEAFAEVIVKGKELNEWKKFRKRGGQPDDPRLDKTSALYYYFHSVGTGDIGISTFNSVNEEKLQLLKRFRNVFDLAYKRYTDIKKAEAQAREAEIELALERVRARTMAMQKSDELLETSFLLFQQVKELGETAAQVSIGIINEEAGFIELSTTIHGSHLPHTLNVPIDDPYVMAKAVAAWKAKRISLTVEIEGQELKDYNEHRNSFFETKINFPEEQWIVNLVFFSKGWLSFSSDKNISGETFELLKRFAAVFEQTYTRFNDLKQAEAQAREAQIEASLERVRAKTMAMHKSSDLLDVVKILGEQFELLGFKFQSVNFDTDSQEKDWNLWLYNVGSAMYPGKIHIPYIDHPCFNKPLEAFKKGGDLYTFIFTKEEKDSFFDHIYANSVAKYGSDERKRFTYAAPGFAMSIAITKNTRITIANFNAEPFSEDENAILRRFANVFEQSYTRFLDLQKAEAQAREAEIELALERVRAKTMAMQKPSEFVELITVIGEQFVQLGFDIEWVNFGANGLNISEGIDIWNFAVIHGDNPMSARVFIPYFDHPVFTIAVEGLDEYRKTGNDFFVTALGKDDKDRWLDHFFTKTVFKDVPDEYKAIQYAKPGYISSNLALKDTWLSIGKFDARSFTDEQHAILRRFGKAFGQAYTRFLDLQKAEAQAREAQIEAGLERVRGRAMAMQTSEELNVLIGTVFTELTKLDLVLTRCVIWVFEPTTNAARWWMANSEEPSSPMNFLIKYHEHPAYLTFVQAWKKQNVKFVYDLKGQDKISWDDILFNETELVDLPDVVKNGMRAPERVLLSASFNNFGGINVASLEPLSDEHFDILLRFAKVFDLTYTRFNDLKQAEAQAREARIETALERVRARTMAMQKSDELPETTFLLFQQLKELGETAAQLSIGIIKEEEGYVELSATVHGNQLLQTYHVPKDEPYVMGKAVKAWKEGQRSLTIEIKDKELKEYNLWRNSILEKKIDFQENQWIVNLVFFSKGMLSFSSDRQIPKQTLQLLERFAGVFDHTYTRFLDLQKAEAQTREAQIELALERVRARTMAMHRSDELAETAQVLFHQLQELGGIPDRIAIGVVDETDGVVNFWTTDQLGSHIDKSFRARLDERTVISKTYQGWKDNKKSLVIDLQGDEVEEWIQFARKEMGIAVKDEFIKDRRVHNLAFFSHGWILVTSHEPQSAETIQILERFASVFNLTYRRFLDLQKAEAQAREAQIEASLERVRSKTMSMHNSADLSDTSSVLFNELKNLGVDTIRSGFGIMDHKTETSELWLTTTSNKKIETKVLGTLPASAHVACTGFYNAWKNKEASFKYELKADEVKNYYEAISRHISMPSRETFNQEEYINCFFFPEGSLNVITLKSLTEEEHNIMLRFARVFGLLYRRFLDLQKAEAQAREAQIEAALEKVRASAMAMHKSDDLHGAVTIMFEEFQKLNLDVLRCGIGILNKDSRTGAVWATSVSQNGLAVQISANESFDIHPLMMLIYECWQKQEDLDYVLQGQDLINYYKAMDASELKLPKSQSSFLDDELQPQYYYAAMFDAGGLYSFRDKPFAAEDKKIMKRFASVVNLTYNRFLDLQKAEAQAREAQIETGLERVRSKTMAMHKSEEVTAIAVSLNEELMKLGFDGGSTIIIMDKETGDMEQWTGFSEDKYLKSCYIPYFKHPCHDAQLDAWKKCEKFLVYTATGDEKKTLDEHYFATGYRDFPESDKKWMRQMESVTFSHAFMKYGAIHWGPDHLTEEQLKILQRFSNVFEQSYTRFLDLQKAEAQARDAQIEASLERVRSKTMAMHNSQDVADTVATMFDELVKLGVQTLRCGVGILHDNYEMELWTARPGETGKVELFVGHLDMKLHPLLTGGYDSWKNKQENYSYELKGEDIIDYFNVINNYAGYAAKYDITSLPSQMFHNEFNFNDGVLFSFSLNQLPAESVQIFKRFAGVFGQTYRRYLDLQKAESQARESQIEASLERVRSKTMAMHNSEDVGDTVATMFAEFVNLGIETIRCGIAIIHNIDEMEVWTAKQDDNGKVSLTIGTLSMTIHPMLKKVFESWKNKESQTVYELSGEDLKNYFRAINNSPNYPIRYDIETLPQGQMNSAFYFPEGCLFAFSPAEISIESSNILKRFAGVFGQTYRRYLDLQKAEAQAREAQIEAGLERVRARTMAMHSSEDVGAATATMFTELERLGIENLRGGITNIHPDRTQEVWSVNNLAEGKVVKAVGTFNMDDHPFWQHMFEEWINKKDFVYTFLAGKEKEDYIKILNKTQGYLPQSIQQFPDVHFQVYSFNEGGVWTNSLQPHSEEDKQVMKRFASVFSLTFRRYQDLRKAEAQAKEATIEAALEKVRGKAMAMHNSNDLSVTASMIITELRKLGISPIRCGVGILNKETHKAQLYTATSSADGDSLSVVGWVMLEGHPVLEKIYETWLAGEDYFPELSGDSRKAYYEQLLAGLSVPLPDFEASQKHYGHFFAVSVGCLYTWSDVRYNDDEIKTLKRFASIIDLTFRRYFELQKSEANAREAVKQAALDRVRAEIASMRTVSDLERITPLIWNELNILGIPFIRCGVFIMDEEQQLIHTFLSTPDGKAIAAFHLPYTTPGNIQNILSNWHNRKRYIDHWDETEFTEFAHTLVKQGALASPEQYLKTIPKGGSYLHFLPFLQGMLYVGNTTQLGEEEIELIQHVADAFSTAYARYEDFNKLEAAKQQVENTLTDLKQAQTQLVQSEKMASLGELTAGIAHEIQNPLNFVNNFSEVSKELLDEMKTELETGNTEDAKEIADNVIQNLEKINHHGKRADAIVKSMLQHSRSSSGKKEPTDINGLADEYLRLAYHGLRAKDKSFNAKFETEFDNSIGKINIISQDIGRVLVNLINNAFYAVSERKKQESNGYEPTVAVLTKKIDDKIEIKVKDNGNGIPQKVLDKIFQPFFTTKPTGQGTGLGLSLSYDIVTKGHGGELKVETKEKEGTIFIVQLPL